MFTSRHWTLYAIHMQGQMFGFQYDSSGNEGALDPRLFRNMFQNHINPNQGT